MKKYEVEFFELKYMGDGVYASDGQTSLSVYEDTFTTNNYYEALEEFEKRKKEITEDNMLGVILGTWENEEEIDQISYTSDKMHFDKFVDNLVYGK